MSTFQFEKAKTFYDMHINDGCFLMPNAWDIGSAKLLVSAGFKTIGTTSAGIAFSLGHPDNIFCSPDARLERDIMMTRIESIAQSVSVPLNADLEGGFGVTPEIVFDTIKLAIKAGAVGGNIEDYTGNENKPLFEISLAVERIKAARKAIDESGIPFVLVGRTDSVNVNLQNAFNDAVLRANLYREAGADCIFVPGISNSTTISRLLKEVDGPINVVMGLTGSELTVSELKDLGVRRISIGGSLARSVYFHIRNAAMEMFDKGTFSFANEQIPQGELNNIFENKV
jgi:2-methylisocitrate lyase-like PEP mutase family enzyme